ncbi:MAG: DUF2809 domain-containing protein [Pseudomonadota bacterium]|uniref:DUF2809 domain-containing protein n=1 Tax=Sphingomonas sp. ERG5 TaxID=1381597 RepID=UPI00054B7782|nr:DUF2809 domain-containing protein [Sphingomonas sp. ERG5]
MTFRLPYALAAIALFAVEIAIALFVHDRIIRPHIGDSLAVALLYLALRAVTPLRITPAAMLALGIAIAIEFGQLFGLIGALGLSGNVAARFLLGAGFDPLDFIAYVAGALVVLTVESMRTDQATR